MLLRSPELVGQGSREIALSPDWRFRPLDALQWVIEQRVAGRLERVGERWKPYAYCRTKVGLETALSRLRCDGIMLDGRLLAGLPERFENGNAVLAELRSEGGAS